MGDFKKAQELFKAHQKTGGFQNLMDCLHKLDELIKSGGTDAPRADSFKQLIGHHIDTQLDKILDKTNVYEFVKDLNDGDKLVEFLDESLSKEDSNRFLKLFGTKKDYFK